MTDLVTKIDEYHGHHTNDLTREIDTYLTFHGYGATYVYDHSINGRTWGIRYPGATRGHIEVDKDNVIIAVKLYDDSYHTDRIYSPKVRECFNKYIGMRLIMVKENN